MSGRNMKKNNRCPVFFVRMLAAVVLLAGGMEYIHAGGGRDQSDDAALSSYLVWAGDQTQKTRSFDLFMKGTLYHLKVTGYRKFILGCYADDGVFYVWDPASEDWRTASPGYSALLEEFVANAGTSPAGYRPASSPAGDSLLGYEGGLVFTAMKFSAARPATGFMDSIDGSLIRAPLPGASVPSSGKHHFVLALYNGDGERGDIFLFNRPASWFRGEAELFNMPGMSGISPTVKSLNLLHGFFAARGFGDTFREYAQQHYPDVSFDVFQNVAPEIREQALKNLSAALVNTLTGQFMLHMNGRPVFSNFRSVKGRILYGSGRNIYVDTWLLFCFLHGQNIFEGIVEQAQVSPLPGMRQISTDEGFVLARNAMRYFTWGVEYRPRGQGGWLYRGGEFLRDLLQNLRFWEAAPRPLNDLPLRLASHTNAAPEAVTLGGLKKFPGLVFDSPFAGGGAGYPLPSVRGGMDTPASFAHKVLVLSHNRGGGSAAQTHAPFGAGVDSAGLFSGIIAMHEGLNGTIPGGTVIENVRRFGAVDLANNTTVIPDLSLVRPGDFLVRFRRDDIASWNFDLAVVVGFRKDTALPAYGSDQRRGMEDIIVIYPDETLGQVTLASWGGGPEGGGFTSEPESFHVRRLLRRREEAGDPARDRTMAIFLASGMEARIHVMEEQDRLAGPAVRERWIPNTGEFLLLSDIEIKIDDPAGARLITENQVGMEIVVSGAKDRYYDPAYNNRETFGNIYNNCTDSRFELALVSESRTVMRRIGILESDNAGNYRMSHADSALYYSDGKNRFAGRQDFVRNRFWVDRESRLRAYFGGEVWRLGIRPLNPASARPGDDLVLQFALRLEGAALPFGYDAARGEPGICFYAADTDYIAVYDKKILWRANLYINEGAHDWNDVHPWNAPAAGTVGPGWWTVGWGYNDWTEGNAQGRGGGQIVNINPWNWWGTEEPNAWSVAYGWGSWDPVYQFNAELMAQAQLIRQFREQVENEEYRDISWMGDSTAPRNDWHNYVFPARSRVDGKWNYLGEKSDEELKLEQHPYFVNGSEVSVPLLSSYIKFQKSSEYESNQTWRTSGIDCSGLAHRAACYPGSPYWLATLNGKVGSSTFGGDEQAVYLIKETAWSRHNNKNDDTMVSNAEREIISLAVPGDILVHNGVHVTIVQDILPDGEGRITNFNQVRVIHSAVGNRNTTTRCVRTDTWKDVSGDYQFYSLVRYR